MLAASGVEVYGKRGTSHGHVPIAHMALTKTVVLEAMLCNIYDNGPAIL